MDDLTRYLVGRFGPKGYLDEYDSAKAERDQEEMLRGIDWRDTDTIPHIPGQPRRVYGAAGRSAAYGRRRSKGLDAPGIWDFYRDQSPMWDYDGKNPPPTDFNSDGGYGNGMEDMTDSLLKFIIEKHPEDLAELLGLFDPDGGKAAKPKPGRHVNSGSLFGRIQGGFE